MVGTSTKTSPKPKSEAKPTFQTPRNCLSSLPIPDEAAAAEYSKGITDGAPRGPTFG
jgi:hypothetical protein